MCDPDDELFKGRRAITRPVISRGYLWGANAPTPIMGMHESALLHHRSFHRPRHDAVKAEKKVVGFYDHFGTRIYRIASNKEAMDLRVKREDKCVGAFASSLFFFIFRALDD